MLTQTDASIIASISKELSNAIHEYDFEYSQDPKSIATADAEYLADRCEEILTKFFARLAK